VVELNRILLADCMDVMKDIPDKYFELAIVDPPYGIGNKLIQGGTWAKDRKKEYSGWDSVPDELYFKTLMKISKNQIIWGGNYFNLPPCRGFIIWDKPSMRIPTMADCEFAWTSFDTVAKIFKVNQEKGKDRIHLSQKPVALYRRILQKYAKPGDKIIDTHSGSGSCAIACHLEHFDFLAIEKDPAYHLASVKRFDEIRSQGVLF